MYRCGLRSECVALREVLARITTRLVGGDWRKKNIVRFGRDAERCVGTYPSGVYPRRNAMTVPQGIAALHVSGLVVDTEMRGHRCFVRWNRDNTKNGYASYGEGCSGERGTRRCLASLSSWRRAPLIRGIALAALGVCARLVHRLAPTRERGLAMKYRGWRRRGPVGEITPQRFVCPAPPILLRTLSEESPTPVHPRRDAK